MAIPKMSEAQQSSGDQIFLDFMKANPDKASLQIIRNDSAVVSFNAKRKMPLASTVKIIIAIEYAEQVASGLQNPDELIAEKELDKYYVPNTDGGAHLQWKQFLQSKNINIKNGVPLNEIVQGMIIFSSNANAEFLMEKLRLAKINARWESIGMQHDIIYPFVSALFMVNKFPGLQGDSLLQKLRSLSNEKYVELCNQIHQQLKNDSSGDFKKTLPGLSMDIQKIWSDRLPGSDAKDYAELMQKIVDGNYFPSNVQKIINQIIEWPMELNPANKTVYKQLGMKGGSTAFVLTMAAYAEDMNNNKTAFCFMFNDLTLQQQQQLQQNLNTFLVQVINSDDYQNQLKNELN